MLPSETRNGPVAVCERQAGYSPESDGGWDPAIWGEKPAWCGVRTAVGIVFAYMALVSLCGLDCGQCRFGM